MSEQVIFGEWSEEAQLLLASSDSYTKVLIDEIGGPIETSQEVAE